ncbi:hypothetical protein ACQYRI_12565 [Salmonella enterica]
MTINEFKPFATGDNANIPPQEDWELNPARDTGFQSGVAKSAEVNKALRQATSVAAAVAQFVTANSSSNMLDDGDITALANNIAAALKGMFVQKEGDTVNGTLKVNGEVQTTSANSFRSVYGNFGTFWRQDGKTLYLMLTDSGNQYGTFNALRPFQIDLATGNSIMGRLMLTDYSDFDVRYYGKATADSRYVLKMGDTITGPLNVTKTVNIGTNGDNSLHLQIGNSGSGFAAATDGAIGFRFNGVQVGYFNGTNLNFKQQVIPGNYANFDARYQVKGNYTLVGQAYTKAESDARYVTPLWVGANFVSSIQRGTRSQATTDGRAWEAPAGCVMTGTNGNEGSQVGISYYRPLQMYINGAWRTITG